MEVQNKQKQSDNTKYYIIGTLLLLVFLLLLYIIVKNPKLIFIGDKEKELRDSIVLLRSNVDSSVVRQAKIQHQYDSLLLIEPGVIYSNHEKTKFIFNTASPDQLDSIIKSVWGKRHY